MSSAKKLLIGAVVLLILNQLFNSIDESGLHAVVVTGILPADQRGALDMAAFRARSAVTADTAVAADSELLRSELLRYKSTPTADAAAATYAVVRVHRRPLSASDALAAATAVGIQPDSQPPRVLRTVFPESVRWRQARVVAEEGMHAQVS